MKKETKEEKKIKTRKRIKKKYGAKCFLEPKRYKYPICNKHNGKVNCKCLNNADYYLNINIGKLVNKTKKTRKTKEIQKKMDKYFALKTKSIKIRKKHCKKN